MIAGGSERLGWEGLPPAVHAAVEGALGSPVVEASSQAGGFSPGSADRVLTADGRRAFVKAVSRTRNAVTYDLVLREGDVLRALAAESVSTPRVVASWSDDEWAALVLDDIPGRHADRLGDLDAVLDELQRLPVEAALPAGTRAFDPISETIARQFGGWQRMRDDDALDTTPPWAREPLARVMEAAAAGGAAVDGDRIVHGDLRADNVLRDASGRVWLIDWP